MLVSVYFPINYFALWLRTKQRKKKWQRKVRTTERIHFLTSLIFVSSFYFISFLCFCFLCIQNMLARAIYDNIAESPDELAFKRGDLLTVIEQDTDGLEGWWLCTLRGRQVGCFAFERECQNADAEHWIFRSLRCFVFSARSFSFRPSSTKQWETFINLIIHEKRVKKRMPSNEMLAFRIRSLQRYRASRNRWRGRSNVEYACSAATCVDCVCVVFFRNASGHSFSAEKWMNL